jgi:type III restriction enzyme
MNPKVREIAARLSLRSPQREALEILSEALSDIGFESFTAKNGSRDVVKALEILKAKHEKLEDFEREFISLCFALATGVGKTRLMGAFIAYLYLVYGVKNFFVLAPNLTIYNKLIRDFTVSEPKYVFRGLTDFVEQPTIITGDNYAQTDWGSAGFFGKIRINVFNISKINSEVRGGKEPKIKRFQEVLGEGYFAYLSNLPDLVLLMDESHRYRASAGVRAINELRPALGLELTATPFVETTKGTERFKNIVQDYPLGRALKDGFVKEPVVVTRKDFLAAQLSDAKLEEIKLEDGIRLHEKVKVELYTYHKQTLEPLVKPFVLIIARDTTHASALRELILSHEFFKAYHHPDKVLQVDSSQNEELMIERLLKIEHPDDPTEIVIHVNMLKEGWDVTNLYTIVPLRAASARILIEQSIGRGLRLPYGRRVSAGGLEEYRAVDRLNIVAHDKFQEIIDEANKPSSLLRMQTLELTDDDLRERTRTVVSAPSLQEYLGLTEPSPTLEPAPDPSAPLEPRATPIFTTPEERRIAVEVFKEIERLGKKKDSGISANLLRPEVQAKLIADVQRRIAPSQSPLEFQETSITLASSIAAVVAKTSEAVVEKTISIPRIMVVPVGEVRFEYEYFTLELDWLIYRPETKTLAIYSLQTNNQEFVGLPPMPGFHEDNPEDAIVSALVSYSAVDYLLQSELIYDLARQVITHLREQGIKEEALHEWVQQNQKAIAWQIYTQMRQHQRAIATEYEHQVSSGFLPLKQNAFTAPADAPILPVQQPPPSRSEINKFIYGHFKRCLYPTTKFQSDAERILAAILERDSQKWFRPARGQFQIEYRIKLDPQEYQPDFVAELEDMIVLLEVKANNEMTSPEVLEKKRVATLWCFHASSHAAQHGGKPWQYHIIAHDLVSLNVDLKRLMSLGT